MDSGAANNSLNNCNPPESHVPSGFPNLNLATKPPINDSILSPSGKESPGTNMAGSPGLSIPSPIITKRTRTNSTYDRAMENPIEKGRIKNFNRGLGHGFIVTEKNAEEIFVHVSDIEGEYVPREGDEVNFRVCPIPPKMEKHQAIHVRIVNFTPDVHLKWDAPLLEDEKIEATAQTFVVD